MSSPTLRFIRTLKSGTRGITLVELIVTLAIFGAVTVVLLVSFLTLFSTRDQLNVAHQANNSVRNVLDGIDREIQAGNNIEIRDGGSGIKFVVSSRSDQLPYQVEYRLHGETIEKAVQKPDAPIGDPCKTLIGGTFPDTCFLPLTQEKLLVSTLHFSVVSAEVAQGQTSPLVTLGLTGSVEDVSGNLLYLTYSTTITPRNRISVSDVNPNTGSIPGGGSGGGGASDDECTITKLGSTYSWSAGTSISVGGVSGISCGKYFCCEGGSQNMFVCQDPNYHVQQCP